MEDKPTELSFNSHFSGLCCTLQKWSKGKVRDKLNNLAMFDKVTYDKLYKEVPAYKLITPAVVSERLKIRASLARKALEELEAKGLIKQVLNVSIVGNCLNSIKMH